MNFVAYLYLFATPISPGELPQGEADSEALQTIIAIVFGFIGAVAVLMIVISGLRYITSAGDPQKASQAKNGIIYALVGIAVALAAQAIIVVAGTLDL